MSDIVRRLRSRVKSPGNRGPSPRELDAADEIERLRQEFREIITFAETRRQDGIEMGAAVWRIALEDIIVTARDALK